MSTYVKRDVCVTCGAVNFWPRGGIGIHKGLKILRPKGLTGSSPVEATT